MNENDQNFFDSNPLANFKNQKNSFRSSTIIPENERFTSPYYENEHLKFSLPGHGTIRNSECGKFKLALQCPSKCEKPKIVTHKCDRISCPICHDLALAKNAARAAENILSTISSYRFNGINVGNPKHAVFSPPPGKYSLSDLQTKDGYEKLLHEAVQAYLFLYNGSYPGCYPIVHYWRQCHTDGTKCNHTSSKTQCGKQHEWYFSPHVHLIYVGYLKSGDQLYHSKKFKGSIFKRIDDGSNPRDIQDTITYLLSHATVPFIQEPSLNPYSLTEHPPDWYELQEKREIKFISRSAAQITRPFGIFKTSTKVKVGTQDVLATCSKCNSEIAKYDRIIKDDDGSFLDIDRDSILEEPYFVRININQWYVKINGEKLLGVRSAAEDEHPFGFLLIPSEKQKQLTKIEAHTSPESYCPVVHMVLKTAPDSNWPEFNYYDY